MALGFTHIVYRLPPELRHADGPTVAEAVRANPPSDDAKVAQWDSFGAHGSFPGTTVLSNSGYPDSVVVEASLVRDRCPELDPTEWVVVDSWDMS